jgi:hypothetical protein
VITTIVQFSGYALAAAGGLAGLAALFKIGPERKKITADAFRAGVDSTQVLSNTAVSLLDPYLEQIKFLRTELASAREEITSLRTEIRTLQADLTS